MDFKPISRMLERIEVDKQESDLNVYTPFQWSKL